MARKKLLDLNDMSKISNDNVVCYMTIKKTMACLQMRYVVTIYMSVLEESATLEAIMSFIPRSVDYRKN